MKEVHDEVCGMKIDQGEAVDTVEFQAKTYYFCSERCRRKFEEHPGWYVSLEDPS